MRIDVTFTPFEASRRRASGLCAVVDVLRASSSIVTALSNGCAGIHPISEPSEAFPLADGLKVLACGERDGVRIPGYHLGNSPAEFSRRAVAGKRLVMCTTNGTNAVRTAGHYRHVFIGCFLNAPALALRLARDPDDATIICAGRQGDFSMEDALCAGMILSELEGEMSDAAVASVALFEQYRDRIAEVLLESEHGRFLQRIGFAADIDYCARAGVTNIVPEVVTSTEPHPCDLIIKATVEADKSGERRND
jgi:2-phosphosulfolactate phosphatase